MNVHVFLIYRMSLGKRDKMGGLSSMLPLYCNTLDKFNDTGARMLGSIYHMA